MASSCQTKGIGHFVHGGTSKRTMKTMTFHFCTRCGEVKEMQLPSPRDLEVLRTLLCACFSLSNQIQPDALMEELQRCMQESKWWKQEPCWICSFHFTSHNYHHYTAFSNPEITPRLVAGAVLTSLSRKKYLVWKSCTRYSGWWRLYNRYYSPNFVNTHNSHTIIMDCTSSIWTTFTE